LTKGRRSRPISKHRARSTFKKRRGIFSGQRYPHGLSLEPLEDRLNLTPVLTGLEASYLVPGSATNASSITYTATFSEPVTGVDPTDFAIVLTGTTGATLTQVQPINSAVYKLTVSGITGSGALGLNLVADWSIEDVLANPLISDFTGQSYTIDHVAPYVQSIVRTTPAGPNSNTSTVSYTVTFSESVTGVDPTDFSLALTGTVGTTLTQVQPISSSVYKVIVAGITGNGTLGLNLLDNYTVRDLANNPLRQASAPSTFQAKQDFVTGALPYSVTVADVNLDKIPDLVTANCVLLGIGNGTFLPKQDFATSGSHSSPVADVNGDGKPDLVGIHYNFGNARVLLGVGDGTFLPQPEFFATDGGAASVKLVDVNGDGKPDLVSANYFTSNVSVLLGIGNGTFQAKRDFATGSGFRSTRWVEVADVNRDGIPDLITANYDVNTASVLLGVGDGTFLPKQDFAVGSGARSVEVADVNGDGKPDLVTANRYGNTASVLLGIGNGTFQAKQDFATGTSPWSVAVADMNGDGIQDLLTANRDDNTVSVLLGIGNGTFLPKQDFAAGSVTRSVAVADLNGDGKLDFVTANQSASTASVLLGNGNGNFTGQIYTILPASVVARNLFYNQSAFDGSSAAINGSDDTAIATDKTAYLPMGSLATFASVSSYSRGINGIMVDLVGGGAHVSITANDFVFKVGNNNTPGTWASVTAAATVSVRTGAGVSGSDRVEITWADNSIKNTWLEVQILPNANTGLWATDVFFWGNKVGDVGTGTPATTFLTSAADKTSVLGGLTGGIPIANARDFNRDGNVTAADATIVLNSLGAIVRLQFGPGGPFAPADGESDSSTFEGDIGIASALACRSSGFESMGPRTIMALDRDEAPVEGTRPTDKPLDAASFGQSTRAVQLADRAVVARLNAMALELALDDTFIESLGSF